MDSKLFRASNFLKDPLQMLSQDFFARDPLTCARELIGHDLVWGRCRGRIVETEAYAAVGDEASHTFLRRGARRFVEMHPPGTAYIYLNYGVHWLLNALVKGEDGLGFVLIRALEPRAGIALMHERRKTPDTRNLCSGPGKLTQALAVPPTFHGSGLCADPKHAFHAPSEGEPPAEVITDVRIGITRAADFPWRFLEKNSPFVSRPPIGGKKPSARSTLP
jgi:DNA-3-methyladenine glycosylase